MIKVRIVELEEEIEVLTRLPKIPQKGDQICCFFNGDDLRICNIESIRYCLLSNGDFDEIEIFVIDC